MEVKLFEVRDRGTTLAAIGMKPRPQTPVERWLYERAGFGERPEEAGYIFFGRLGPDTSLEYDQFKHSRGARTLQVAHQYVSENWERLRSGDLVDVEFILGERKFEKTSEYPG